jgi:hypothetical protein
VHGGRQAQQLVLQQREALRHAHQQHVHAPRYRVLGGEEAYGVLVDAVARQVGAGRLPGEERVRDLHGVVCRERRGEGAPPVADHDDRAVERPVALRDMPQQILVGGVPRTELVTGILGEARQHKLGRGGRHTVGHRVQAN